MLAVKGVHSPTKTGLFTPIQTFQEYVRELAICLVAGGQALMWDLKGSKPGRRLAALHDELCCLCAAKATADLDSHHDFVRRRIMPAAEDAAEETDASPEPDWLELAVSTKQSTLSSGPQRGLYIVLSVSLNIVQRRRFVHSVSTHATLQNPSGCKVALCAHYAFTCRTLRVTHACCILRRLPTAMESLCSAPH